MSEPTPLSGLHVTKEDFSKSGWEGIIAASEERNCWSYGNLFSAKVKEAEESGDIAKKNVFTLLLHATYMLLKPDSKDEPFSPMMVLQNSRSAIIDDFTEEHLALFKELVTDISDPELRARLADIVWVRKRDFRMAELAIDSYLESATVLEHPEKWPEPVDRITRALHLAAQIGTKSSRFPAVIAFIENLLQKLNGEDPLFFSARLMEMLQEYRQGDPRKYAKLAEKSALRAESSKNWHLARSYWAIKTTWHNLAKDGEQKRESMIRLAETYVQEAEDVRRRAGQGYMVASHHIQSAIQALSKVSGTKQRRNELYNGPKNSDTKRGLNRVVKCHHAKTLF